MDFTALQDSLQRTAKPGCSRDLVPIESRYQIAERVGHGAYGDVFAATQRHGARDTYAVKRIDKRVAGAKGLRSVMGEVETMSLLSHPNIVKLEETYEDDGHLWIVMEYLPGGSLQHRMEREVVSEGETRRFVTQLLMAVEYIHERGIVHRDLKPSNCLLSQRDLVVKIADFGLSVLVGNEQCLTERCGTPPYMAPEILLDVNYGKAVDMWALGVLAHVLFYGHLPFDGITEAELARGICGGYTPAASSRRHTSGRRCPPLLQDFLSSLLTFDPAKRATASDALKHPWIRAGMELNRGVSLSMTRPSLSLRPPTAIARWRSAALAVIAAHRLLYLQKLKRLLMLGFDRLPILRNYHYLVSGVFDYAGGTLRCAGMFYACPLGLLELVAMTDTCLHLRNLDLSRNNIHSLSLIQAILRVVGRHPALRSLDLSHNPIPAMAGRAILRLARSPHSSLTSINVGDTGITSEMFNQINTILREKSSSAASSKNASLTQPVTRSTSQSTRDADLSSTISTMQKSRISHGALYPTPHRPPEKSTRLSRLPPIPHFPPLRPSEKQT